MIVFLEILAYSCRMKIERKKSVFDFVLGFFIPDLIFIFKDSQKFPNAYILICL